MPLKFIEHITSLYDSQQSMHVRLLLNSARYCNLNEKFLRQITVDNIDNNCDTDLDFSSALIMENKEKEDIYEQKMAEGMKPATPSPTADDSKQCQLVVIGCYLEEMIELLNEFTSQALQCCYPMDIIYNVANFVGNPVLWLRIDPGLNIFQWSATSNIRPLQSKLQLLSDTRATHDWNRCKTHKKPRHRSLKPKNKWKQRQCWRKMEVDYDMGLPSQVNADSHPIRNSKDRTAAAVEQAQEQEQEQEQNNENWYFSGYVGMHADIIDRLNIDPNTFMVDMQMDEKETKERDNELSDFQLGRQSLLDLDWCFVTFLLLGLMPDIENDFFRWYFNQKLMSAISESCSFSAIYQS
jgi:hypothetical protein